MILKYKQSDSNAYNAVDGTGFHCYGGNYWDPANLTYEFPDKNIYFTECTGHSGNDIWGPNTLRWHQENLWIGQPKHARSKNVLLWNVALDESFGPNLAQNCEDGKFCGCSDCRGLLTLMNDGSFVTNIDRLNSGV